MEEEKIIYFIKKKDLLYTNIRCPYCSTKDFVGVPNLEVECRTCGKKHRSDLKMPMYIKMASLILKTRRRYNRILIRAEDYYEPDLQMAWVDFIQVDPTNKKADIEEVEDNKKTKEGKKYKRKYLQLVIERKAPNRLENL
jgi:hypothetical protein